MLAEDFLAHVQQPARYVGSEFNMVRKDPTAVDLRVAMCYPDAYEVGMSHLGLQILYHCINQRPDTYCERCFHPQTDASALLRERGLPLWALESGDPLSEFDVVGITLQYELTFTGVLGLLDLGGIPLQSADRGDADPIVLGGGPCALNPEPMAPFFDALVMGDGEEAIHEVLDALKPLVREPRGRRLEAMAGIAGVYVPSLHDPERCRIARRVLDDIEGSAYPTRPVMPFVEVVHDRAQVEVARGCTRGCRFCQAGMVYRPVRERSLQTARRLAGEIVASTGYDEVSLVSLNCPDYTHIGGLIDALHEDLADKRVSVGLPSLRIDTFSVELAQKVQRVRKSGLTFAPEAGSQRLRDAINKGVTEQDLLDTVQAAFAAGWHTIKLYFMIGLPTETDEDVLAIADLVRAVAKSGREALGKRAGRMKLHVSVSTLVPKAHTPLQWDGQISGEEIRRRQDLLRQQIRDKQVAVSFHHAGQSVVEAALARGGRETAAAILSAYRQAPTLDAWSENFDYRRWQVAFAEAGLCLEDEAQRRFSCDEPLPWAHIDTGVCGEFLLAERAAVESETPTPDCRFAPCSGCGVSELIGHPCRPEGESE